MSERETWTSRVGFVMAAVGSAVGLGNVWQFPFQTGTNGGAAFPVVYLIAVVVIGSPAMLVEFVVGRRAERSPIDAFARPGHGRWRAAGVVSVATAVWVLSFHSVVGGWVIRYLAGSVTGASFGRAGPSFERIAAGREAVALTLVLGLRSLAVRAGLFAA